MKKFIIGLGVAVGSLLVGGAAVQAAAPPPVNVDTTDTSTVAIAAPVVTLIVSLLIPLVNGFFTTITTSSKVKAYATILLNAVSALITNGILSDGSAVFSSETLYTWVLGTVVSVVSYAGLYKPLDLTSSAVRGPAGDMVPGRLASVGRT